MIRLGVVACIGIFVLTVIRALLHLSGERKIEKPEYLKWLFRFLIFQITLGAGVVSLRVLEIDPRDVIKAPFGGSPGKRLIADQHLWVDGWSNVGRIQGVWWVSSDESSGGTSKIEIIKQGENSGTSKVCVSGTTAQVVDGRFQSVWGAMLGLNICMNGGHETPPGALFNIEKCPRPISGLSGFRATFTGNVGNGIRVRFRETERPDTPSLVAKANGIPEAFLFKNLNGVTQQAVEALIVMIDGNTSSETSFDFCISDVEPVFQ